ncbi:multidrug effflux MFS transporter [Phenylobacterium montanum]|uniref:Bcr/CflA family efflux transporter n=2 Tax=Phenylobacterium montanum TaxID=2823693 RepID=A0A975G527_9CAUL|nr:multidrug effflux MFS transporter [Caulobacter sp. S6]
MLGALTAFSPMSIDMYLPAMPAIGRGFHATGGEAQLTLATFLAGLAFGQLFYGPASDRWGRRPPLLFGVLVYVLASAVCALAPTIQWLMAARFVQALGGCAGPVIARAAVRDRYDARNSARVLSLLMLVMGLAPVVAPFFGAALLTTWSWRGIFWVLVGFGVVMAVVTLFGLRETRSAETEAQARSEHPLRGYLALATNWRLVGYMMSGAFNAAALFAYISAAPGLIMGHYGVSAGRFVWVFGANAASMIAMSQVNAFLLKRHTPDWILMRFRPLSLVAALAMVLGAVTGFASAWGVLVPLFFVFASFGFIGANTMALGLSLDPLRVGSASALIGSVQFGVGALVSSLISMSRDEGPLPLSVAILACMIFSTVALVAASPRRPTA